MTIDHYNRRVLATATVDHLPFYQGQEAHGVSRLEALNRVNQWNREGHGRYQYWIDEHRKDDDHDQI